jgi:hypothetical protein
MKSSSGIFSVGLSCVEINLAFMWQSIDACVSLNFTYQAWGTLSSFEPFAYQGQYGKISKKKLGI